MPEAAGSFAATATYARPPALPQDEFGPREVLTGRVALQEAFVRRGLRPFRHRVDRSVGTSAGGLFEGLVVMDDGTEGPAFLSSYGLDREGLIQRYLTITVSGVPGLAGGGAPPGDGSGPGTLARYFSLLRSAPDEAARQLAPGAIVSVLLEEGAGLRRVTASRRDETSTLLAACTSRQADWSSTLIDEAGGYLLAEGHRSGDTARSGRIFLASVVLDTEGRVWRHLVLGCESGSPSHVS
jgi:hypothetical protein